MATFLQPCHGPFLPEPGPLGDDQLKALMPLSTEEIAPLLADLPLRERIEIARALHDLRKGAQNEKAFEEQVELNRERKKAKHEADARDRTERDAYLSSEEGLAEAAAAFEAEGIIDPEDLDDPESLIDGFLHMDTMARTFGPPKSLKSFVTLDMAACVSLGIPWQGRATRQVKVLYVVAEGARGVKHRKRAWNEHHQDEMKVMFYSKAVQIGDQEAMHKLIAFCVIKQIGYVIFDTQARCTVGVVENDNTEMGEIVAALDILKQRTGACVHLVHHSVGGNDEKARGATAWDGAVDAEFAVKRDKQDRSKVELVTKFQKDISEADPLQMKTLEVGTSLVLAPQDGGGSTGTGEVAAALVSPANAFYLEAVRLFGNQPVTITDVENDFKDRQIKRSRSAIKKAFGTLQGNGALEPVGAAGSTAVKMTQAGLVFSDQWRRKQAASGWTEDAQDPLE